MRVVRRIAKAGKTVHLSVTADIARPFLTADDPDRHIRCQDSLETAVQELESGAISAGWSERDVLLALTDLVDHQFLSLEVTNNADMLIALLR